MKTNAFHSKGNMSKERMIEKKEIILENSKFFNKQFRMDFQLFNKS